MWSTFDKHSAVSAHANVAFRPQRPNVASHAAMPLPGHRLGAREDIAAWWWCSCQMWHGYVTGRTVFVNGGMTDYPDFAHGG